MPDRPVPLSAVGLRLTDEVGQIVLDWVAAGDLAASAALDQHVAAIRGALASCQPGETATARLAGEAAGQAARSAARSGMASSGVTRPHHARRSGAVGRLAASPAPVAAACPDVPFTDSARYADDVLPLGLLLHYACGFVEAAVRADWWPGDGEGVSGAPEFEALRLAAVCRLVRQGETTATAPPETR